MIIPGFKNYDITTNGVVTFASTGRVIKPHIAKVKNSVYKQVRLVDTDGNIKSYNIMTLLAVTYLNKPLSVGIARAKDGNNLNTVLDNVYWTTQAEVAKQTWQNGGLKNRRRRGRCYDDESIALLYDTMQLYTEPVPMTELSTALELPYSTVRYSMTELLRAGKVRKSKSGFEVIR